MSAYDHINPDLRNVVRFSIHPSLYKSHQVTAINSETNQELGSMDWNEDSIGEIEVDRDYQGRGIGTALWVRAQQAAKESPHLYAEPKHSIYRTDSGDEWAHHIHKLGLSPHPGPHYEWNGQDWVEPEGGF